MFKIYIPKNPSSFNLNLPQQSRMIPRKQMLVGNIPFFEEVFQQLTLLESTMFNFVI